MTSKVESKYEIDMCSGNLFLKIIKFSVPLALIGFLQLFYNMADLLVVGMFGNQPDAVGAIGSTNSLISLLINFFMGLSVGTNVMVAKLYGANQKDKISNVVHTSILSSLVIGIVVGTLSFIFAKELLLMTNNSSSLSLIYIKIYFVGLPFNLVYNFSASILRAVGDTKRPLYYLTISGIVNIILNFILVYFFNLGVEGVAISTVISQFISCVLIINALVRSKDCYKIELIKFKFHKDEFLEILRLGLPAGIQSALFSISNVIIQSSVNLFNNSNITNGNSAASTIEGFVYTAMNSVYHSALAFTGQNYGARKSKNIKLVTIYSLLIVTLTALIMGGTLFIFGKPLLDLFVDGEAINIGYIRLHYLCLPYFLCGIMDVMVGVLRGLSLSLLPMIVSIIGICGFRIFWIYVIFRPNTDFINYNDLNLLYISYPISWIITFLVHLTIFLIVSKKIFDEFDNKTITLKTI